MPGTGLSTLYTIHWILETTLWSNYIIILILHVRKFRVVITHQHHIPSKWPRWDWILVFSQTFALYCSSIWHLFYDIHVKQVTFSSLASVSLSKKWLFFSKEMLLYLTFSLHPYNVALVQSIFCLSSKLDIKAASYPSIFHNEACRIFFKTSTVTRSNPYPNSSMAYLL